MHLQFKQLFNAEKVGFNAAQTSYSFCYTSKGKN